MLQREGSGGWVQGQPAAAATQRTLSSRRAWVLRRLCRAVATPQSSSVTGTLHASAACSAARACGRSANSAPMTSTCCFRRPSAAATFVERFSRKKPAWAWPRSSRGARGPNSATRNAGASVRCTAATMVASCSRASATNDAGDCLAGAPGASHRTSQAHCSAAAAAYTPHTAAVRLAARQVGSSCTARQSVGGEWTGGR